jgi:hypothetical protein
VWRGVLEYFDAHVVGLTATPGKQTFAFFRQNLVSEYTYPQSVADRVNVDFDLYRIRTEISEKGGKIDAGLFVPKVDRRTRKERLEQLEEDYEYTHKQLDRAVTAKSQLRLVLETFRDRLFTEIFPGRSTVPKTLIFAKDDAHAEEIVTTAREVFGKGNDFAAKITYAARDAQRSAPSVPHLPVAAHRGHCRHDRNGHRCESPGELLAIVPYLLGFEPSESITCAPPLAYARWNPAQNHQFVGAAGHQNDIRPVTSTPGKPRATHLASAFAYVAADTRVAM